MKDYVGKQKLAAKPGVGLKDDSTFFAPVARSAPATEILLKVTAKDGNRYFRVLEFTPDKRQFADLGAKAVLALDTVRLGQELQNDPGNTIDGKIDTSYVFGETDNDYIQHVLTFDSGKKKCHVHSFKKMEK
jgi:hypothetical protein